MSGEAAALVAAPDPAGRRSRLVAAWLEGRSPRTREAYSGDLEAFRRFLDVATAEAAAEALLAHGAGSANELVLAYRQAMISRGLASATVNRRLAALRSLVSIAGLLGLVEWTLRVRNLHAERRRETAGPGEGRVRALLAELATRTGPKAVRDLAILRLLLDLGLRRFEVTGLDVEHIDLAGSRLAVLGKGKRERQWLTLPPRTVAALAAWMGVRGTAPGPLFCGFARGAGRRLESDGLYRMVRALGEAAGVHGLRTHGLRHTAITAARRRAHERGLPIEEVLDFSRHADVKTLQVYLDRDVSRQGEIATMVSEVFP